MCVIEGHFKVRGSHVQLHGVYQLVPLLTTLDDLSGQSNVFTLSIA